MSWWASDLPILARHGASCAVPAGEPRRAPGLWAPGEDGFELVECTNPSLFVGVARHVVGQLRMGEDEFGAAIHFAEHKLHAP